MSHTGFFFLRHVQNLEQWMVDFLPRLNHRAFSFAIWSQLFLLDLHELMSSILHNKIQTQSVSALIISFSVQWFGLFVFELQ